jgi:hypothetical protein
MNSENPFEYKVVESGTGYVAILSHQGEPVESAKFARPVRVVEVRPGVCDIYSEEAGASEPLRRLTAPAHMRKGAGK